MDIMLERLIKNDDSAGDTFHLMKKMSEMEKIAALAGKILTGKEADSQEISTQTRRKCNMEKFKVEVTQENIGDTYNGRAWEDLPTHELVFLTRVRSGTALGEKAEEILAKRYSAMEADIKALDDGSVKGLIVSGDYINLGRYVGIQRTLNGVREWIWKSCNESYGTVYTAQSQGGWDWECVERVADDIVTLCRRKFKKDEIILYIADDSYSPEIGIVFTENKICTFDDKKLEYIISYAEMEDIDFDEDSVTINVSSGEEVTLYCDDEEYSKGVFNLLMDIKDRLAQA